MIGRRLTPPANQGNFSAAPAGTGACKDIRGIAVNRRILLATTALAAGALFGTPAHAGSPIDITCTDSQASDQAAVSMSIGGGEANLASGDVLEITGICAGDYKFTVSGITIGNSAGNSTLSTSDGFNGMLEISGAHVTINGITLEGTTLDASNGSNATNITSTFNEDGDLVLHDGAVATVENSQIGPGTQDGMVVIRTSAASVLSSKISGNGTNGGAGNLTSGIWVSDGSSLRLGDPDDSDPVTVQGNGLYVAGTSCSGFDLLLTQSASGDFFGAQIGGTTSSTGANCGEVDVQAGSSVRMRDLTLGHFGGLGRQGVVYAIGGSSVWIDENTAATSPTGSTLTEVADGVPESIGLVFAGGASSIVLQDTTLTGPTSSGAMVEASASSTLVLAGGNNITTTTSGGTVIEIDHSSSMLQLLGRQFGYANLQDNIAGAGLVQVQSSMDLGQGLYGSDPSLIWIAGSGANGIQVQQNSSFRLSGGVSITGTVTIKQNSNGFLNLNNGGAVSNQTVSGGISCPFNTVPASHIASPTDVMPNVSMATSFGTAVTPQCLPF